MRIALWCLFSLVLGVAAARAQSITTGAVQGRITDAQTGEPLGGVTITIGSQVAITEPDGSFKITELLPGKYDVVIDYATTSAVEKGVVVGANNTTSIFHKLKIGEAVFVTGERPRINIVSPAKETRVEREEIESLPTGPTFEGALRGIPGTQNDGVGIAMSGSSALENRYLVDGIDITGLTFGNVGTPLLNDFIHEIVAVSGGYGAEYGRSTGGVVNIITRYGTDELRGSVFGVMSPGFLALQNDATPTNGSSIDIIRDNAYDGHFGFELGGPIVKKRAWFYVGMAPQLSRTDFTRITKRQTDCHVRLDNGKLSECSKDNADAIADIDPDTGFFVTDEIDREVRSATSKSAQMIGKINVAVSPAHQAQLSVIALPNKSETPALFGVPTTGQRTWGLTTDTAARWTSKLGDGSTEVEALVAWHRSTANSGSIDPAYDDVPLQQIIGTPLHNLSKLGGETPATIMGCNDDKSGANDPYPFIDNCPNPNGYSIGGQGFPSRDLEERRAVRLSVLHRIKAIGTHEVKGGLDLEDNHKTKTRLYGGGAFIQNYSGQQIVVNRFAELARPGEMDPAFDRICTSPDAGGTGLPGDGGLRCRYIGGLSDPSTRVEGQTLNWGAYLQDSWHPLGNLTLNAGMRYEEQRLFYAKKLRGEIDPLTGGVYGDTAMRLRGNWSPRVGAIWDPSNEGKSKIYGAWGRYYEGIPMDINDRSFGGEVSLQQTYTAANCGMTDPQLGIINGMSCLNTTSPPDDEQLIGSSGTLVAPGIKAQYMDESLLGAEIALGNSFVLGAVLQYRRLGRVIEDVSTDNAQTYIIANPGEWSKAEEEKLLHEIATTTDKVARDRLENQLRMFRGIRIFDRPQRDYAALELTLSRKFTSGLFLSASYTYSRAVGNYPGLVSYDNGQIDPNISSQYDLIELLGNRRGNLPQDRPHYFKLDAYRSFEIGKSTLTIGGRVRALSGIPTNALGAHSLYGVDESFLLPRGQLGRTSFDHGVDLHVGFKRSLSHGTSAELYVDVFNAYNRQGVFRVDETYAPQFSLAAGGVGGVEQNANPISGGTYEDLIFAKSINSDGAETSSPLGRNPNFGRTTARYAPASAQVGFRVTF